MIYISEKFETDYPDYLLELLMEFEDNWRLTIPDDAVDPLPWLQRYGACTALPTFPDKGSSLCLVTVLAAQTLSGDDVHVLAALVPTPELFQRLVLMLASIYERAREAGHVRIPLVGVFFTLPRSIVCERDPELFE